MRHILLEAVFEPDRFVSEGKQQDKRLKQVNKSPDVSAALDEYLLLFRAQLSAGFDVAAAGPGDCCCDRLRCSLLFKENFIRLYDIFLMNN